MPGLPILCCKGQRSEALAALPFTAFWNASFFSRSHLYTYPREESPWKANSPQS